MTTLIGVTMAHERKIKKKKRKSVNPESDLPGTSFGSKKKKKPSKSKKGISKAEFAQGYCVCK